MQFPLSLFFFNLSLPLLPCLSHSKFPCVPCTFFPLAVFFLWNKMQRTNPTKQLQKYTTEPPIPSTHEHTLCACTIPSKPGFSPQNMSRAPRLFDFSCHQGQIFPCFSAVNPLQDRAPLHYTNRSAQSLFGQFTLDLKTWPTIFNV